MLRKILKWTVIVVLLLVAGLTLTTIFRQHLKYEAPYPNIKASNDSAVIARGKHLVVGPAHCIDCHSPLPNKDSLLNSGQEVLPVGGMAFNLPFGKFYTRNLTPDKETGIGNMTDGEVARVLRYGVKKNGEAVLPFMPFQEMSDEDLTAIVSYLRSLKPVKNQVPDHEYNPVGRLIKAFLIKPVGPSTTPALAVKPDTTIAFGKHMVMAVANCNECHTKRDGIGNFVGEQLAGGTVFEEKGHPTLVSPNLTPDPTGRIYNWSQDAFIKRFRLGKLIPYSHMPWEAFGRMTDTELIAIYKYLKTVKPAKTGATKKDS